MQDELDPSESLEDLRDTIGELERENARLRTALEHPPVRPDRRLQFFALIVAVTAFLWGFMGASERGAGLGLPVH